MPPRTRFLPLFLALLTSCYDPDFSKTYLRCDAQYGNRCPDGKACLAGWCGPPWPAGILDAPDAAQSPADASSSPDLWPWSGVGRTTSDACTPTGPSGNAYVLRPNLVACLHYGLPLRSICKAPWRLCGTNALLSKEECRAIPWGFYSMGAAGEQPKEPPPIQDNGCVGGWSNFNTNVSILYGCGTSSTTPTYDSLGYCRTYYRAVPVATRAGQPITWWVANLTTSDPTTAMATAFADGALCCLP